MKNVHKDKKGFYYFPLANNSSSVIAAFTNRHASLDYKEFLRNLSIDYRKLVYLKQVHKADVIEVSSSNKETQPPADAMITKARGLPLAVFSADCLSLFFYDPKNETIGLGHAGWRGSWLKIAKKIVMAMEERFSTSTDELIVGFGPSIRSCCYQVGEEFYYYFPKDIIRRPDGLYLDLIKINKRQLYSCGIRQEKILDSGLCTSCLNREFFSYRKEGASCGRMLSLMMLKFGRDSVSTKGVKYG